MKEERILEILSLVDEKFVEEAAPADKEKVHYGWTKWALTAACVIGISWFGLGWLGAEKSVDSEQNQETTTDEEQIKEGLLVLTPGLHNLGAGNAGGLMAYDISEGDHENPWTKEASLETLPVYQNLAYGTGSGETSYLNKEELLIRAEAAADALETEIQSIEYITVTGNTAKGDTAPGEEAVYSLTAITDTGEIQVEGNGLVVILLNDSTPLRELPQRYNFADGSTTEEAQDALEYLLEKFNNLHCMASPVVNCSLDRAFDGDPNRRYTAYEGSGDLLEQILNYNFNTISFEPGLAFIPEEAGKLTSIRYGNLLESSQKLGDYPIISWEAAKEKLLNGRYITAEDVSYLEESMIKEEYIAKVELVYITGRLEQYYIPYYKFYVELTQLDGIRMAEDLKWYGAFYVPAVSEEYLTDFSLWSGSYN